MLVLSRKKNESIVINDDIAIVVVEIRGDRVRLGIQAPKEIPVDRGEIALMKRSTPEQKAFIRRARKSRISLVDIEATLNEENNAR